MASLLLCHSSETGYTHMYKINTPVVVNSAGIPPEKLAVFVDVSAEQQRTRYSVYY